jgi:hypothetical protein
MPSFDVHQHLWPAGVIGALRRRRVPPRLDEDVLEVREGRFPVELGAHELEERLTLLDRHGVDTALVSLQPTLELDEAPELVDAYHEGIVELVAAAGGRLRAFACGACLEGFAGACIPAGQVLSGLGELPTKLEHARQALFVHPGPPAQVPAGAPPWWSAVVEYAAQMQGAYAAWLTDGAARHPNLPVVFALLAGGGPVQLERLRARGGGVNGSPARSVYLETSSFGRRGLELCLETHGASQLLYGSDVPVIDPRPTLDALVELGETVAHAVRVENPTRLFA